MKLLVQSDDYGFTRGCTLGIIDAIDNGIVTCTGMFVNMPESEHAATFIKDRPNTCFGIDFNIVSGKCVADPKLIPNLVDENGDFIRSTVKYAHPDFGKKELWPYDEVIIELRAQLERFRELVGKDPEYLHGHSISRASKAYVQAIRDLSKETGIPFSMDLQEKVNMAWLKENWNVKPFTLENQLKTSALDCVIKNVDELLDHEYATLGGHAGLVDAEIFKWSTYTVIRAKDHEMLTSDFIKNWIKENNVELITYRDLLDKD